jgi:mRNA-degrading endonuclease RelE of RelBE toxin-antitoxin system
MREWRILYEVDDDKHEVLVADIRHRGDAYGHR